MKRPIQKRVRKGVLRAMASGVVLPFALLAHAGESVTVELSDGRRVTGEVDAATDEARLWLRTTDTAIVLRSGFEWGDIRRVRQGEERHCADEFRRLAGQLATDLDEDVLAASGEEESAPARPEPPAGKVADEKHIDAHRNGRDETQRPTIRWLEIEAVAANWDDDVETDGLRVFVSPVSAEGEIVPVDGTLDLRLIGRALSTTSRRHLSTKNKRALFPELGRWSRRVRREDFQAGGVVYELPFRTTHPEFRLELAAEGLLTGRLGVPGRGAFDASDAHVRIRPYSRFRDFHQQRTGSRFHRDEFTRRWHR